MASHPWKARRPRSIPNPRPVHRQGRTPETRVGWTVGAGVEWAVWDNWSVKLEYDYLDFGSRTVTFNDPLLGANNISISRRISEVKLGVNYRFGSPLPTY